MEVCKQLIKNLMEKNLIINKGKNDTSESFKTVEKNAENINAPKSATTKINNKITESNEKIAFNEEEDTLNGLGSYVNEKFHDMLINLIKKEVDVAVSKINTKAESSVNNNSYIKDIMVFQTKEIENLRNQLANIKNGNDTHNENPMKDLITAQNKSIEFLSDELASKDIIIQMLLQEKDSNKSSKEKCNKDTIIENNEVSEKFKRNTQKVEGSKHKRSVLILGDSMLKDIEPTKVRNGVKNNVKVYLKAFPGATTNHMISYANPSKEFNNELIILHCGTNDLRSNKQPNVIAKDITDLAMDLKTEENDVMVSCIAPRRDNLNQKAIKVNELLQSLCSNHNIHTIDNSNIKTNFHLNNSGLHLNYAGTYVLGGNIVNAINI